MARSRCSPSPGWCSLNAWQFGPDQAAAITQPVLSLRGTETERLFVEGHELLHSWFPQLESCTIEGIAHLLHMQRPEPVAQGIAEFFARHPITAPHHAELLAGLPEDRHVALEAGA